MKVRIFYDVLAGAVIVVGGLSAGQELIALTTRSSKQHRALADWRVVSDPAGQSFRMYLLATGIGVLLLISESRYSVGSWLVVGAMAALLIWECALRLKARGGKAPDGGPKTE